MFVNEVRVKNFRLFDSDQWFEVKDINAPDSAKEGSGLTVFVGENGCGKTALLDAVALPFLSYKADNVSLVDFNDPHKKINIEILAGKDFHVLGTMPKGKFQAKGFSFEAGMRKRNNRSYLSSIVVSDQRFIKADGQDKPVDGSPDLRVNVNNPFKGPRFSENDMVYLDKSRTFQVRTGAYNSTRFDRLMEDMGFQYLANQSEIEDLDNNWSKITENIENSFLRQAINKFQEVSGIGLSLNVISNIDPFCKSFLAEKKDNGMQVPIEMQGSGYEMIFSFIYAFCLANQSGKQLIMLIDEPELHLHPAILDIFVKLLLEYSKNSQIIMSTHSPLLIKQLFSRANINVKILVRTNGIVGLEKMNSLVLPYISANEINYLAFGLATDEYHNELYGYIQEVCQAYTAEQFDKLLETKGVSRSKTWKKKQNDGRVVDQQVSLQTYIRHSIHHPENKLNQRFVLGELDRSIKEMISTFP